MNYIEKKNTENTNIKNTNIDTDIKISAGPLKIKPFDLSQIKNDPIIALIAKRETGIKWINRENLFMQQNDKNIN